ncbi:MFS transporter [Carnobacterium gallinarum]|uniref:MFS transporter n=1 Tax=Carnobacterium gallinarum TaxID=2749 RepID=UPI0005584D77|nr:MFS transporter [Carnobacterium gallinarum]
MKKETFGMILPITLLAYFLILMDNSIVFTSSIQIGESLRLSDTALSWVSNAYTLTFGGFLLLSGRLSDLLGRKRIFIIGLTIFCLSSLMIGIAPSGTMLIIMRGIQGIGSSIIAPTTLALMMDAYEGEMRKKAISYYGATAGIGSSLGLLIGGGLTSWISWRAGFLINVPIAVILILLTLRHVKDSPVIKLKIDYLGCLLSVIGLVALIYGLTSTNVWLILGSIVILGLFIFRQTRIDYPLLPLELVKNNIRSGAYVARLLFMMSMLPYWFYMPQVMQSQYGFSPFEAGIGFLPLTLVNFMVALQLPRWANKLGNDQLLMIGEVILLVGLAWTGLSDFSNGYWLAVALPMIVIGFGQGMILAPVTSAGIHEAPQELAGIASGVTNMMHQIGGPIGLSIIVATTSNFHVQFKMMAGFTLLASLVVAVMILGLGRASKKTV